MPRPIQIEDLPIIDVKSKAFDYGISKTEIPEYILNNLKYEFFDWQKDAFENFLVYQAVKERENPNEFTHLMFNMATGTGKTLIMAASILYYYSQGYKHFLFFVNQNNIVDKTENNFVNSSHTKYLFKEKIVIDDKTVLIKKVDAFSENPQGIEIKFTSIQKLYNDIHLQREGQTTLDDLHVKNIVMLADEAHHLNTDTSRSNTQKQIMEDEITSQTSKEEIERKGWEHTVLELILNRNGKGGDNKNVLLEFTATIPSSELIVKKYENKIIFKFGLKEFLQAGYTKEINLISSTLDKKERVLQALLFQWYRHKIALKNNISNFKPVILFRSKTIEESKVDYGEFLSWIERISIKDFDFLKIIMDKISDTQNLTLFEQGKSRTEQVLGFIKKENINLGEIVNWIHSSFQEKNTIITNSKTNKTKTEKTDEETEKLLNSLEDKNNNIRAIFTVDRLTEGWDVLNLYDIVRLYQGQNAGGGTKKTPEATIKEKQLIGRGVRYYPFPFNDKIRHKRKFDNDLGNELRVLEELYYYTYDEQSRYISHLKEELKRDGYIREDKIIRVFGLKKDFQESSFYKNTKLWYNKQIDNPYRRKKSLDNISKDFFLPYKIRGLEFTEEEVNFDSQEDLERVNLQEGRLQTISIKFKDIDKHIILKAINIKAKQENSLFRFDNLKEELEIESIEEIWKEIFANFELKVIVEKDTKFDDINNNEKLTLVMRFLDAILNEFKDGIAPKIGSDFIPGDFKKFFAEPKTKTIEIDDNSERISRELEDQEWYVLDSFNGTNEEQELIEFIKNSIGNLENKYKEIYLLRNEEVYKIFDFEKGRGFQPDFLLFLKTKGKKKINSGFETELNYQIFIESKGNEFLDDDGTFKSGKEGWKEKFMEEISIKYGLDKIIKAENPYYRLIGLPFFNKDHNQNFEKEYNLKVMNN